MDVTVNTRISELVKADKASIEAIAALAKPLEKLRTPILRKVMASRVTIGEAAKMGGCTIQDFERVLTPLGFRFLENDLSTKAADDETPDWLKGLPQNQLIVFDVRGILTGGQDPLKQIIKRFKEVPNGNALCIINAFVPVPLIRLLEKEGVETFTRTVQMNEFHTFFYKVPKVGPFTGASERDTEGKLRMLDQRSFQREYDRFSKAKIREIDVRHLAMPEPMQTILGILAELNAGEALYVNHKRVPLYLLEEIADEDYCVNILSVSDTDVKLLIFKIPPS